MLVLSRKKNESIQIGDSIRVVLVDIRGDKVRLGIDAPPSVRVMRTELLERERYAEQCVEAGCISQGENVLDEREYRENSLE